MTNRLQQTFQDTRRLDLASAGSHAIDFYKVHAVAKNAIYIIESLDAALRSLDGAIARHTDMSNQHPSPIWRATHDALLYRKELFHSTGLRMSSAHQRLRNAINLVCCSLFGWYCIPFF